LQHFDSTLASLTTLKLNQVREVINNLQYNSLMKAIKMYFVYFPILVEIDFTFT